MSLLVWPVLLAISSKMREKALTSGSMSLEDVLAWLERLRDLDVLEDEGRLHEALGAG